MRHEGNQSQLNGIYEQLTASVICECVVTNELVGGQPADEQALYAFAEYHLKIADPAERERAVKRILREEVGEKEITPEGGEIKEEQVYGVNVIRRSKLGAWLGDWQIKANLKQAASRSGIFVAQRGSKGNFSEAGKVSAVGGSLKETEHPERIYLTDAKGEPAATYYTPFMGRVNSPQGSKSIVHHSECVGRGTRFAFEFRFLPGAVSVADLEKILTFSTVCGLGSVRSMERGKFSVERYVISFPEKEKKDEKKTEAKSKGKAA